MQTDSSSVWVDQPPAASGTAVPLDWRGPGWLTAPIAVAFAAGLAGLVIFLVLATVAAGAPSGMTYAVTVGGLVGFALLGAVVLSTGVMRTFPSMFAATYAVGHSVLAVTFALVLFVPSVGPSLTAALTPVPPAVASFVPAILREGRVEGALLVVFAMFSIAAPLALGIVRFTAFRRAR